MRFLTATALFCASAVLAACSEPARPRPADAPAKPPTPAAPPEMESVAQSVLGSAAEVLVFGDLAHTGREQVLVVNRLAKTPPGQVPGLLVTRVVVAEKDNGKWKEVLRGDEHLKNSNGFLGGTPIAPVTGWRLQYEQSADKGLVMYFTPLGMSGSEHIPTIGVRWNRDGKRYQSLGRNFEQFLGEVPTLENIDLRRK